MGFVRKASNLIGVEMGKADILRSIYVSLTILCANTLVLAQESLPGHQEQLLGKRQDTGYSYNIEGRSDPFKPFVAVKVSRTSAQDPNEIVDEQQPLAGMQLFEPGQLTLVGIIHSSREPIALVEDQTRKGYTLRIGNLIGKRGIVSLIEANQVVITETAKTRGGQEMKTTTTMRLKKEGDR